MASERGDDIESIKAVFRSFVPSDRKTIPRETMLQVLLSLDPTLEREALANLIELSDVTSNDDINYEDFVEFVRPAAPPSGGDVTSKKEDGPSMADQAAASAKKKAEAAEAAKAGGGADDDPEENGHAPLLKKMTTASMHWAAMAAKVTLPEEGFAWPVAMVADQDEDSKQDCGQKWQSHLAFGKLVYNGAKGTASYSFEFAGEAPLMTERADKSGRGAEYSALEIFGGKMFTFDDRTGNMDELVPADGFSFEVKPVLGADGAPTAILMGDGGNKKKPLKCEWSCQKGGKLYVGSTGKERTDDDGKIVHEGEMWVKVLDESLSIEHFDWRGTYNGLRDAAICKQGAGYIIHESARWSDVHDLWFFLPRKSSRQPYDEIKDTQKCVNLMMAAPDGLDPNGGDKVYLQAYLDKFQQRGCSDFLFVPGTNDGHLFVIRTEESLEGVITTYGSVIDLTAKVLMEEMVIGEDRKFEGCAWVGGFGPFPPSGPTASVTFEGA